MAVYNLYPGVDSNYDFPPEILSALRKSVGHYKGNLPPGGTLDSVTTGAYYAFSDAAADIGIPGSDNGLLEVFRSGAGGTATYVTAVAGNQQAYMNTRTTLGWIGWVPQGPHNGTLTASDDIDKLKNGSYWTTPGVGETVLGIGSSGRLDVVWFTSAIALLKLTTGNKTRPDELIRIRDVNGWGEWTHSISSDPGGSKNKALLDDMVRRMGGVTISDTGAVSIRYDHGLKNFYQHLWPIHKELNLPFTITLSSRSWDQAENEGVTPAMMNVVAASPLCEISNHGAVAHVGSKSELVWRDYIEGGLTELEEQLPNAKPIDTFIVPGTSGVGFGDFITGASIREINSYAGQFILSKHALLTGALSGTSEHPLDGNVRQGMSHTGFGENSLSSFQSQINTLIANKTGGTKMMHPSQMNTTGFDTTAQIRAKLVWLAAQRAAGRIHVVQMRKLQTLQVLKNVDGSFRTA